MTEMIESMISEEEISEKVWELGKKISEDYAGTSIHLICILNGASFFFCDLARRITVPVTIDFMSVKSYGNELYSSGELKIEKDLEESIEGKEVLIVEDIIDTGQTLSLLENMLKERRPKSLKLCTFLDKPSRRIARVDVTYCGFEIEDQFAVGYGLDYANKYRNLPYIGVLKEVTQKGV